MIRMEGVLKRESKIHYQQKKKESKISVLPRKVIVWKSNIWLVGEGC